MKRSRHVAEVLGQFVADVAGPDIPPEARSIASRAFVDTAGVAIAGASNAIGQKILEFTRRHAHAGDSVMFGGDETVSLEDALLANGTLAHCLDFDDTNHPLYAHPSAVLVTTAAGVGAVTGATGAEMVTAYLVGHEVEVALARAINHDHYAQGFHATGTLGVFGATAAAARLLRLDALQATNALSIAASSSSGVRGNIGSMTKPLHAGIAVVNGHRAARLAEIGWHSSPDVMEKPGTGYFAAYAVGKTPEIDEALDSLGRRWSITEPFGQQIKPYPSCGATHPAIEAASRIHEELASGTSKQEVEERIESVTVGVCELLPGILVYDTPSTGHECRFSLPYTVSCALTRGRVGLSDFTEENIFDPRVRALMTRVKYQVDERVRTSSEFGAIVTVQSNDGRRFEHRSDFALGKNAKPMNETQLHDKVSSCLKFVGASDALTESVWQSWRDVDSSPDATSLWGSVQELWQSTEQ